MRAIFVMAALCVTAPAMACDLDYLPDFAGHSYQVGMSAEEAARAREEAMANARAAFLRQYGLADAEPAAPAPVAQVAAAPAETPATNR